MRLALMGTASQPPHCCRLRRIRLGRRPSNGCVIEPSTQCRERRPLRRGSRGRRPFAARRSRARTSRDTNLSGANLTEANLSGAQIIDADLSDADLTRANLTDATITGTNLDGATLCGTTRTDGTVDDTSCPATTDTTETTDTSAESDGRGHVVRRRRPRLRDGGDRDRHRLLGDRERDRGRDRARHRSADRIRAERLDRHLGPLRRRAARDHDHAAERLGPGRVRRRSR